MRWPWHRNGHDAKEQRAAAEREASRTRRMTPAIARLADALAEVPPDELAERLRRALKVRHP